MKPSAERDIVGPVVAVKHHLPGRTRIEAAPGLAAFDRSRLARALADSGWALASFGALTRTAVILHPADRSAAEVMETVLKWLMEPGQAPSPTARAETPDRLSRLLAVEADEAIARLGSSPRGLTGEEAARRLAEVGPNLLPAAPRRTRTSILRNQLGTLPVGLLFGSALLSLATGGVFEAVVTLGVIALNAGIGFGTENAVESLIARLGAPVEHKAEVVRDGRLQVLPSRDVAPGDLLALAPGQAVAADARVIEAFDLVVDESILTGESLGVSKTAGALSEGGAALSERWNMVHAGSVVLGGQGRALAVHTGARTEAAAVRGLIASARPPKPIIEEKLDQLSRTLVLAAVGGSALVLAIGLLRRRPLVDAVRSAISLAVASLPEGLSAVATTTFALSAKAMEREGVYVRMLPAVESIGVIDTLCLDKTGTLTENRMTVVSAAIGSAVCNRADDGGFLLDSGEEPPEKDRRALAALAEAVALCNSAERGGDGSGTELALLDFAERTGLDVAAVRAASPRTGVRERSQARRHMATLHERDGDSVLFVKGAPEDVLSLCGAERRTAGSLPLSADRRADILRAGETMAARGQRVLGVARAEGPVGDGGLDADAPLQWLGLVGLSDPLRASAREAVRIFHAAGVRTQMITGDHPTTAEAVARDLGLANGGPVGVLTGAEMAELDEAGLRAAASRTTVFARVTPSDKLRIVRALQAEGAVVGMLGDGVNDGPALREARVGVAMGRKGSDVAREVADVVIADDDLAALARAVARGRATDDNIRNAVRFLLSTNLSEILVMLVEAFGPAKAQETPMELFWLNLVSDVMPALGLALAEPAGDVMRRPPSAMHGPIVGRGEFRRLGLDGIQIAAAALAAHFATMSGVVGQARTATFITLAGAQLAHAFSLRGDGGADAANRGRSLRRLELSVAASGALLVLPFAVPPLGRALGVERVGAGTLGLSTALVAGSFGLSEVRRLSARARAAGPAGGSGPAATRHQA